MSVLFVFHTIVQILAFEEKTKFRLFFSELAVYPLPQFSYSSAGRTHKAFRSGISGKKFRYCCCRLSRYVCVCMCGVHKKHAGKIEIIITHIWRKKHVLWCYFYYFLLVVILYFFVVILWNAFVLHWKV